MGYVSTHVLDTADKAKRLALILAHQDLAGRAAQRGEVAKESISEQAGSGIDQCAAEEFARFRLEEIADKY